MRGRGVGDYLPMMGARYLWETVRGVRVPVVVVDLRTAYGRVDARVRPVEGTGETWVDADSLTTEREGERLTR